MPLIPMPAPIAQYFAAKLELDAEKTLACFADDATVWDNGESLELRGRHQIQEWLTGTVSGYDLSYEVVGFEPQGSDLVATVVVTGNFPGSPYKFENRFQLAGEQIAALTIDPIGSLA